ncbi:MAG: hypothetical protein OWS74_08100 [Firmicutes bacterium]|nr:hypothetical protein [Bacillota bacterium]
MSMSVPDEKKQILDGLSILDQMFGDLEFLAYDLDDRLREGAIISNVSEVLDALNRTISTIRLTIDYISEALPSDEIKATLGFYRAWISYLNKTLSVTYANEDLMRTIFSIVFDVINDLYRSFKDFKKQVEDKLTGSTNQQNNLNQPIPTREL